MRKAEIDGITKELLQLIDETNIYTNQKFWDFLINKILTKKIKFQHLEVVSSSIFKEMDEFNYLRLCIKLSELKYEGGYVIIGKILQLHLENNPKQALDHAEKYIIHGDIWYCCDIIAERVIGYGLLTEFNTTYEFLKGKQNHQNSWIVRGIGIGIHYAVKKGITSDCLPELFEILTPLLSSSDHQVKKGVGRAIKTITKYYPEFINQNIETLTANNVNTWIKSKIKQGMKYHDQ